MISLRPNEDMIFGVDAFAACTDGRGHAFTKPGHVANQTGRFGLGIANAQAE